MQVTTRYNQEKNGIELVFSQPITKEQENYLTTIGFSQNRSNPLKWSATRTPAYSHYGNRLQEALTKGESFEQVKIKPSYEPSSQHIDYNKFSLVTITFLKDKAETKENYIVFDHFKKVATEVAKTYAEAHYGESLQAIEVFPRRFKTEAKKLLADNKFITGDNTPTLKEEVVEPVVELKVLKSGEVILKTAEQKRQYCRYLLKQQRADRPARPKPMRSTKLRKLIQAIVELTPDHLKHDPKVQREIREIAFNILVNCMKLWDMNQISQNKKSISLTMDEIEEKNKAKERKNKAAQWKEAFTKVKEKKVKLIESSQSDQKELKGQITHVEAAIKLYEKEPEKAFELLQEHFTQKQLIEFLPLNILTELKKSKSK